MGFNEEYAALRKKRKKDFSATAIERQAEQSLKATSTKSTKKDDDDDIAPVKETKTTTEEPKKRTWFQGGEFEDGYQFGDVFKTVRNTSADVMENLTAGILGIGESVVDAGAYVAGGVGKLFGADKFADKTKEFIAKDTIDEKKIARVLLTIDNPLGMIGTDTEKGSLFGDKTDSIVQSGGQLVGTVALQSVGVPWFVTTGVTSFGGETENAFNQGASYGEAGASAAITAGAEILTEKLSGGIKFGGKALDDVLTKELTRGISNKAVRTMAKLGMDVVGEGSEEVISQVISNLGTSLYEEENLEDILFSEEALDEYLESFIGGAVLGGVGSGTSAVNSAISGRDSTSRMTANEEKVFQKVYEDRVAEAEEGGKKLNFIEKNKIHEEVIKDMENGRISTDTIESVLGGETYKAYQDTIESEENAIKELETLYEGDELTQAVNDILENSKRTELKQQLSREVSELAMNSKDSFLSESYNEAARRKEAFTADLAKYDTKTQEHIKKAIESGVLNNTRRTHEFVDMIAKISTDKGVLFDYTNNAKLKESGFAVDGKSVNGFVTKDGVTVNIDSQKALNSIVGHEITHVLEGTEFYDALQETIFEYAKTKGIYDERLKDTYALYKTVDGYKGVEGFKAIKREVVSDLVGDYLFTDADFINNLSTKNRNVFQKVYDEIKYLCKVATAGSKEARELERVKHAFEQAYRADGKANGETKYSISNPEGKKFNLSDYTIDDILKWSDEDFARAYEEIGIDDYLDTDSDFDIGDDLDSISESLDVEPETVKILFRRNGLGDSHIEDNHKAVMTQKRIDERIEEHGAGNSDYARRYITRISPKDFIDLTVEEKNMNREAFDSNVRGDFDGKMGEWDYNKQLRDSKEPPVLVINKSTGQIIGHNGRHRVRALEMAGIESVEIEVELHDEDGRLIKYGAKTIPDLAISSQFDTAIETHISNIVPLNNPHRGEIGKYYGETANANAVVKYSLSDSDGKQLTKEQQDYFKDSKMRDDNGNLKVMYHGSQDAGFHTFDSDFSDDGTSFFFVDRNDVAASYSGTTETYEAQTIRTADDMNKFLEKIGYDHYKVVEQNGKYVLLENNEHVATKDTAKEIYEEFCWYEGVGEGDANYKVYLNLTNPLEVDAEGRNWNNISREFSQEVADRYHSLTAEEKAALTDLAEWGEYGIFRDEILSMAKAKADGGDVSAYLASAYEKLGGANANLYDAFSIASDNFSDESINQFAVKQMNTRDYAKKAKAEGYDGVIFKNIHDNGGYSNGSEGASTVAIAFNSNQIKSVANNKPTKNADIRYSLSKETDNAYLDAVNRGENETAKKMVDDAAKNAGYTIKAYHGTPNSEFTVFDKGRLGQGNDQYGAGFYFTTDKEAASHYGNRVIDTALDIKNPIRITATADSGVNLIDADVTLTKKQAYEVIKRLPNIYDAEESPLGDYYDSYWEEGAQDWMIRDLASKNRDVGYLDSDLFRYYPNELHEALRDIVGYDGVEVTFEKTGEKFYVAWFDNQMKSTDAVTYDDNGKVIPLSERFNANNNDIRFSLSRNSELMQNAENMNSKNLGIDLGAARQQRQEIYEYMTKNADRLKLPEDIEGNTAIKNSSYDITEENTTVCIRSMAADALCDAVAEELGRPLTVQDTLRISQDLMNYTDEPECVYCYVATDRKAYREFLGSYHKQMQGVIDELQSGKNSDDVYKAFLDGRKDTKNMRNRFAMWEKIANGGKMISAKDLASEKMMQNAMRDPELAAQVKDARAYAQSASWAKKRMGYQAYDGHILDWSQRRINDLNKHYGLRFYSFSDFSPAFVLENMQQMTDASVRGLKGLAYTKVLDFAEIFAPTGININISVFGYNQNGVVAQDGMMGADWNGAQDLRNRYENVGITFVATNDTQIEWALNQDWIDVVIPYHLVRTGQAVAKNFGYTNYTAESGDTKGANWKKGDKKTIYPSEHNNDKQTYLAALAEANLEPRFARWVNHPNYMKLVNETRRSANDTPPMKAEFNVDAAKASLDRMMKRGGYFVPIGGDYANMQDIASEIAGDIRGGKTYSLSAEGETPKSYDKYNVYGKDVRLETDIAPAGVNAGVNDTKRIADFPDDIAPMTEEEAAEMQNERLDSISDVDAPMETEGRQHYERADTTSLDKKALKGISDSLADILALDSKEKRAVQEVVQRYSTAEIANEAELFDEIKSRFGTRNDVIVDEHIAEIKKALKRHKVYVSPTIKGDVADYAQFMRSNFGKIRFSKDGSGVDQVYMELSEAYPDYFPASLSNPTDQLLLMAEVANFDADIVESYELGDDDIRNATNLIASKVNEYKEAALLQNVEEQRQALMEDIAPLSEMMKDVPETALNDYATGDHIKTVKERLDMKLQNLNAELSNNQKLRDKANMNFVKEIAELQAEYNAKKNKNTKVANDLLRRIERLQRLKENVSADYAKRISGIEARIETANEEIRTGKSATEQGAMRRDLHQTIVNGVKSKFAEKGFDFDAVLKKAKNLSTFATVDNTPQRVMEKALGYKEGQILSDLTVNQVAQNETEGIAWLNSFTDRKNGVLAKISKQYNIKAGSKESAAAQMYAEGFYVDEKDQIIAYGDAELKKDFPNAQTRANIIGLASDPRIRQIYDETLAKINESRARNAYPEIQKLDNYFLHFRAMEDTFSRLGLPFNPNDIRAKDLPTDLNGVTADLKPGQPYFASANHRRGIRTSFDLLGGLERYLSSAKNQIYHIDDIQTLRALRNYVADTYGQANGLDGLNDLSEEEAQERIKQVYDAHLSTFAKFLNEEANILAGKTALIDRGLEGIIGRRGITFLDTINKQVGSNMVGFNVSSSLTNFLPVVQTIAKSNKAAFVKAFAQTTSNKISSIFGKGDNFAENSPVIIRRKGADRFYRTPFQKVGDAGYALMGAVDNISTELIARTKFNEFVKKGMDEKTAHIETDKWVSRLMGDRSLGQMPQLYNSKMLGLVTKFQLEVRNQLDSQFYDTIQEAKVSNEKIENALARNAKTAAKVASTFVQLAVAQHLFGKAFESIAGYNPAFDIVDVIIKAFGFDDDEDSEDTVLDNVEEGFLALLEDMPYTSTLTGGRIPISSALPITELIKGEDQYGNEISRLETLGEIAPYYALPTGYGQIKKSVQGLKMFSDDLPTAGSYTDSGNLRFPVEDTLENKIQAGIFGQWANDNAEEYFDRDIAPLNEKQTGEFIDSGMSIQDYWNYRKGLSGLKTIGEKADYINSLDVPTSVKNLLINNIADRKEPIDMKDYDKYSSFEEFDYAEKNPEKYSFFKNNGISYEDYASADEEGKRAYTWAYENPEAYEVSKAVSSDLIAYRQYTSDLNDIRADKDKNGKSIIGSAKEKKIEYINNLDIDYGARIILFKSEYKADDTYNYEIIDYLNSRDDISYEEMETILKELGFTVDKNGNISW